MNQKSNDSSNKTASESAFFSDKFLTTREVMSFLNISRTKLWELVKSGEIPAFKIGGDYRYKMSEITAWLENCRITGQADLTPRRSNKKSKV